MNIQIRKIEFNLHRPNGTVQPVIKEILGDDAEVKWVTKQLADVNNCGVTAIYEGIQIAMSGNIQS